MDTNLYCCTRTGRTISEKTMDDDNITNTKDVNNTAAALTNLFGERAAKLTTNGHDFTGEASTLPNESYEPHRPPADSTNDDQFRKRINPLRIHLGKRPFVDNSLQYYSTSKKKKIPVKSFDPHANPMSRPPKLPPKRIDRTPFHNLSSQADGSVVDNEQDKPVPRLVPKSQLLQFKKGKVEKGQLKDYAQKLGLQPMVKFKCRKCCSMSFKTLAMLKEHQLVCRAQAKEPALSPEVAPSASSETNPSGPSRVTRKLYLCSACGTYYENWNLFLHMREVHNRHICLFCLGMFSKAEKLSSHLTNKHNVKEFNYDSKEEFFNVYNGTLYLMCCVCDEICSEQDDFFNHDCNNVKPKPVPMLVSKNTAKANSVKNIKTNDNLSPANGPTIHTKEVKHVPDNKKDSSEAKLEALSAQLQKAIVEANTYLAVNSDTSTSSENSTISNKDASNIVDSSMEPESSDIKPTSTSYQNHLNIDDNLKNMPNGDEALDNSDESDSPASDDQISPENDEVIPKPEEPLFKSSEKECGIKLKLSLNNASSPVIINSTVDPTVGQQNHYKPPTRVRRPPKRYEKETLNETVVVQPKTPSIKMTICDRADSPFVKTTIYENNKEILLLNNNLDTLAHPGTPEMKLENTMKSTIYDNKVEEENTLNRVPKLTVRVPKELLDKDSSSDYSSDSDVSDKLTVDENNFVINHTENNQPILQPEKQLAESTSEEIPEISIPNDETNENEINHIEPNDMIKESKNETETEINEIPSKPVDPIIEEPTIPVTELSLDKPLDKYSLKELLKVFLASTVYSCIYCNHVRKIAVNCEQLSLHMVAEHRFSATVDSITAEELMPETITAKLKTGAPELQSIYINLDSYDSENKCVSVPYDHIFECFQCHFKTAIHKDLYLHNRKMHQKTIMLCVMCKSNFYSYSELLCHLCPGTYDSEYEIKFRCYLCNIDNIPSSFRLMVHLRKMHHTCDVCLEFCHNQARLSNHVWKHKLHHLCYRCGIAYRNKTDIANHLFWKHGTESVSCKKCLQKKWPHVYHFCSPPAIFICEECNLQFTKAVCLKVHKRLHLEEYPHKCVEENCIEQFVSKKLLNKHIDDHRRKLVTESLNDPKANDSKEPVLVPKEAVSIIDLVDEKPSLEAGTSEVKAEAGPEPISKKIKKKKLKDKDALLLDVNLPVLNLSESDSSDESDTGIPPTPSIKDEKLEEKPKLEDIPKAEMKEENNTAEELPTCTVEEKVEPTDEEKPNEQQVLEIWDNFKKYQAKVEKQKTPPLVPIRKHVCESDHDYCLVPTDINGDGDGFSYDKKKNKKSPKKQRGDLSSSSSSSSDSDSSCSCGSNCSCDSSSSGSSSSSSSDSDSSDESGNEKKKSRRIKKLPNRRISNGSNVDVMGMSETPILIPEKIEPPIAESDLETDESETDEEFYDENPQKLANKSHEEKHSQVNNSLAPPDEGLVSVKTSHPSTPIKEIMKEEENLVREEEKPGNDIKEKSASSKKKSKKKKKSKSSKKHGPIKINIPKGIISKSEEPITQPLLPNKITISLQSNTVQIPEAPPTPLQVPNHISTPTSSLEKKRASKRRRVPNKFYGYSSDEEAAQTPSLTALKPQQPPKLEWRKEDLPSPVTHKAKKEIPSSTILTNRMYNYTDPIRLTAPIPDPEPPRILMNSESMGSSDSDSSDEGNLEIYQPNPQSAPIPPPTYLNSGTSSLPYPFQRPAVREAREGESVYCYCRCPYDEVSEMIACDAEGCPIEWFHFECVGIMVPPKGKWYCPECRKNQSFSGYR